LALKDLVSPKKKKKKKKKKKQKKKKNGAVYSKRLGAFFNYWYSKFQVNLEIHLLFNRIAFADQLYLTDGSSYGLQTNYSRFLMGLCVRTIFSVLKSGLEKVAVTAKNRINVDLEPM